jgi:hypothetical protein
VAVSSDAGVLTVSWTAPTTNTDEITANGVIAQNVYVRDPRRR